MKKLLLLLIFVCHAFISFTQSGLIRKETDNKGTVTFAEFSADSAKTMKMTKQLLKELHDLNKDQEFVMIDSKTDKLGFTH